MEAFALASGSTGNSLLVRDGEAAVLIDAGRSCRFLTGALKKLDMCPADLSAILITHEHTDHVSALPTLLKTYPLPVYLPAASALYLPESDALAGCLCPKPTAFTVEIGSLTLQSLPLSHDSASCVGYRISAGGISLGIATDTGVVTPAMEELLPGVSAVYLESNHDRAMLRRGPYPAFLKARIAGPGGHLSNDDAAGFAARLVKSGTGRITLGHLSEENNTPEAALETLTQALNRAGLSAEVSVARPREAVRIL